MLSEEGDAPRGQLYVTIPRGDQPIDSYDPAYWAACFPVLFPYGDACEGVARRALLSDKDWIRA